MAVSGPGVCSGVLQKKIWENPGKIAGKLFPNRERNATSSRISGTGKGKPAGNLGSTLPGPRPHLPCGMFLKPTVPAISSFSYYRHMKLSAKWPCSLACQACAMLSKGLG